MSGTGVVVEFDARRGLGVVEDDSGVRHPFHCTQIGDGTRSATVGARVRYEIVPGLLGVWEAGSLEPA